MQMSHALADSAADTNGERTGGGPVSKGPPDQQPTAQRTYLEPRGLGGFVRGGGHGSMARSVVAVRIDFVELATVFAHSDDVSFADGACQLTFDLFLRLQRLACHDRIATRHQLIAFDSDFTRHHDATRTDSLFQFFPHLLAGFASLSRSSRAIGAGVDLLESHPRVARGKHLAVLLSLRQFSQHLFARLADRLVRRKSGAAMRERTMRVDFSFMMVFPFWVNGNGSGATAGRFGRARGCR